MQSYVISGRTHCHKMAVKLEIPVGSPPHSDGRPKTFVIGFKPKQTRGIHYFLLSVTPLEGL